MHFSFIVFSITIPFKQIQTLSLTSLNFSFYRNYIWFTVRRLYRYLFFRSQREKISFGSRSGKSLGFTCTQRKYRGRQCFARSKTGARCQSPSHGPHEQTQNENDDLLRCTFQTIQKTNEHRRTNYTGRHFW